jgi:hypothetical protein
VDDPARCPRCLYRHELCLCPAIAAEGPIVTRTRVVILRHHTEKSRSSNSGRLAHLALPNSELHDVSSPDRETPVAVPVLGPGAWLVFPDGPRWTEAPAPPPETLVFLDATWQQARRMRRRLPYLRGLPMLSLTAIPAAERCARRRCGGHGVDDRGDRDGAAACRGRCSGRTTRAAVRRRGGPRAARRSALLARDRLTHSGQGPRITPCLRRVRAFRCR